MHTEFGTYFLMLFPKNLIRYIIFQPMGTTSLSTLVSFSIAQQPEVMTINNLVLQQYFFILIMCSFIF